jgi:hypothetical protein
MEGLILAALYVAVGIGVFAWYIRSNEAMNSDQKSRSGKILILFPELCLFWPIALISEIKRRQKVS